MKRKTTADFDELMKLESFVQPTASYRNMLDNIHPGCFVEANTTRQSGTVESVIRNKYGIPVCIKVRYGDDNSVDYISADRVSFWEPYDYCVSNAEYEETFEEYEEEMLALGYQWDEDLEAYVNEEGDEACW